MLRGSGSGSVTVKSWLHRLIQKLPTVAHGACVLPSRLNLPSVLQCVSEPSIPPAHPSTLFLFLTPSLFQSHPSLYSTDSRYAVWGGGVRPALQAVCVSVCVCVCVCVCVRARAQVCVSIGWMCRPNLPSVAQSIVIQCFLFIWGLPTQQQTQSLSPLSAGM